jgi:hypothetical protein
MKDITVETYEGDSEDITNEGEWDLKYLLQKTMTDLKMEECGLNYDDFSPSFITNREEKLLEVGKCDSGQSSFVEV